VYLKHSCSCCVPTADASAVNENVTLVLLAALTLEIGTLAVKLPLEHDPAPTPTATWHPLSNPVPVTVNPLYTYEFTLTLAENGAENSTNGLDGLLALRMPYVGLSEFIPMLHTLCVP
jgi:hypothetical protein